MSETGNLSFDLHALAARLDRLADRLLRDAHGLSYRRFLALVLVGDLDWPTQRALADQLGLTEPSVSRMVGVLSTAGYVTATAAGSGAGNRRRLALTDQGKDLVERCRVLLEHRFATLVERSGVGYADYAAQTRALLNAAHQVEREWAR